MDFSCQENGKYHLIVSRIDENGHFIFFQTIMDKIYDTLVILWQSYLTPQVSENCFSSEKRIDPCGLPLYGRL